MRGCKHRRVHTFEWAETGREEDAIQCEKRMCLDCRAWLPLGPSDETDPRIALEIRAAEIATADPRFQFQNLDERHGWRDFDGDGGGDCTCANPDVTRDVVHNWHAGYLARCITSHAITEGDGHD